MISAIVGLIIFLVIYVQKVEGQFETALRDPKILVYLIVPFLPAIVLSFISDRAQKKLIAMLQAEEPALAADKKP